jgi:Domain of unknown function (DUF4412)
MPPGNDNFRQKTESLPANPVLPTESRCYSVDFQNRYLALPNHAFTSISSFIRVMNYPKATCASAGCSCRSNAGRVLICLLFGYASVAMAFEGRITATLARAGDMQNFLYTAGTNFIRIERTETNWPYAKNIVGLDSRVVILIFPHNRSFVRLKNIAQNPTSPFSGPTGLLMPPGNLPPGANQPGAAGAVPSAPTIMPAPGFPRATYLPNIPVLPPMPAPAAGMPGGLPAEPAEFKATGETTNLLGYTCAGYVLKQSGEVMEVWATDELPPFRVWLQNQPPRFSAHMIEDQWPELLRAKKLFPLLASLKSGNGAERLHFGVQSVTPGKITDEDGALFQPPPDYHEIEPLPF